MPSTDEKVPAVPGGRPAMPSDQAELYDTWLEPNGIVGRIPLGATITVVGGTFVVFPRWRHQDPLAHPWDDDVMIVSDLWGDGVGGDPTEGGRPLLDERTELLRVPVTDRIRDLFAATGLTLVECDTLDQQCPAGTPPSTEEPTGR